MDASDFTDDLNAIARIDSVQKILEVVCRTTGLGFSAIARVTETRWVACAVRDEIAFGLVPGGELPIETTICDLIRLKGEAVLIEHVAQDPFYADHLTPKMYGFQSYASFPIRLPDGSIFGTLCAIDPRPARLNTPAITSMFTMFADLIGMQIAAQSRMAANEAALMDERASSQLREQFIAVLGHDLRNPLNAISSGAQLLRFSALPAEDMETLDLIQRSAARMAGLIDNVLDFARGRLGGGLTLSVLREANLEPVLQQVVDELRASWPSRTIATDFAIGRSFACDGARLAQMLSNLIGNAISHGDPNTEIRVQARTLLTMFELSVTNHGKTIAPDVVDRLFHPFVRGSNQKTQEGLGLGLYISSEIARAHQGVLDVQSAEGVTRFSFRMPIPAE